MVWPLKKNLQLQSGEFKKKINTVVIFMNRWLCLIYIMIGFNYNFITHNSGKIQ